MKKVFHLLEFVLPWDESLESRSSSNKVNRDGMRGLIAYVKENSSKHTIIKNGTIAFWSTAFFSNW